MGNLCRGVMARMEIISGDNVLLSGRICARSLYNFVRYCAIGYNWKLAKARGDFSLKGKLPKYPSSIDMWKAMFDTGEYKALNDRVASYILRGFDASMRSWFGNLKVNPDARPPRHLSKDQFPPLTFEVGRNAKYLGDSIYRLSVLSGKNPDRHVVCRVYLPPLTNHDCVESIKLLANGQCSISYRLKSKKSAGDRVAGIDLGIKKLVTIVFEDGQSISYHGGLLLSEQRYWLKKIRACMPSGWRGAGDGGRLPKSDRAKSYHVYLGRRKRLLLHNLSHAIVDECRHRGIGTIIVGDLRGIRTDKDFGKVGNQKLHAWSFNEITRLITYKAEEVGIEVIKVSERYTSRTCHACGSVNKRSARITRGLFVCADCGAATHADVNGARNILQKYLLSRESGVGVAGGLPALPSPTVSASRTGEFAGASQIDPDFVAEFDLRNFEVKMTQVSQ